MISENYTVPYFVIYINGIRASIDIESSVKEIYISDLLNDISFIKIKLFDENHNLQNSFMDKLGMHIKVLTGYRDNIENVFSGEIIGFIQEMSESGGNCFYLEARSKLHRLARTLRSINCINLNYNELLRSIIIETGLETYIDHIDFMDKGSILKFENDLDLIKDTAIINDSLFYTRDNRFLFKKNLSGSEDIVLEYGKSLIELDVRINYNNYCPKVTLKSYDHDKNILISSFADDSENKRCFRNVCNTDSLNTVSGTIDKRKQEVLCRNLTGEFNNNSFFISGVCRGDPSIRAGNRLKIINAGEEADGIYLIKKALHKINEKGYRLKFFC